ncbi:lantibiotic ABC transporter permease [Insulibacter thermoxylanivorax]|uniref:Lantibiotic ABC transporter permease n=1 Tax=Insulibacter thermoxylanivorax TaxID=2749268 RepID=A0A916QE40_9BACL|nr:lantibiotic immunity ABC transporter MutE/EpiE family permease subunit [Insulibacter thermoxylanivorax]GFR37284.1 lantibiotic ABC transporter permease [Insulibacter thermoxylanivorax]
MLVYIRAEYLKIRRTFTKQLFWLAPLLTMFMSFALMGGQYFQTGTYNWWYILMLPGALTLICAGIMMRDKRKLNYRAILGLPIQLEKVWYGKIGAAMILYLLTTIILFIGVGIGGVLFSASLTWSEHALGSLLLYLSYLWQIPLCLFLTDRLGMIAAFILNLPGNIASSVLLADTPLWWTVPYAIPARLMCAAIGVLPNGLPVPEGDVLLDKGVILPGVLITLGLFVILSLLTMLPFRRREVL